MNRSTSVAVVMTAVALSVGLATRGPTARTAPGADEATPSLESARRLRAEIGCRKPSPVSIDGMTWATESALSVVFLAEATDVTVRLWGVDGLVVEGDAAPVVGARFGRGERLSLSVRHTPGPLDSSLAVQVEGCFSGKRVAPVRSFNVPALRPTAPAREKPAPGSVIIDAQGRGVVLMPAAETLTAKRRR